MINFAKYPDLSAWAIFWGGWLTGVVSVAILALIGTHF